MNNIDLKNGDVIAINCDDTKRLAIFEKFDTTFGNQDRLYIYVELDMSSKELFFKPNGCFFFYELRYITYSLADDNEKNTLYNAIGKQFTEEYDKDWYKHFTNSSYFDIQDFLFDVFGINVEHYDNDMIYPDFIDEIHIYIWNELCNAMEMPDEVETSEFTPVSNEMVNKQEFIEKTINYFTPILKTYCSEECVKELIDGFVNSLEE